MPDCLGVIHSDKQHRDYLSFSRGLLIHHLEDFLYCALPRNSYGKLVTKGLYWFILSCHKHATLRDIQFTSSSFSDSSDLKSKAPLMQYSTTISTKPICLKIKEKTFPIDTQKPTKQLRLKHLVKQFLLQHPSLKLK